MLFLLNGNSGDNEDVLFFLLNLTLSQSKSRRQTNFDISNLFII
jgi:hypothetical protein